MTTTTHAPFLTTAISSVDGAAGVLRYRGVSLGDLVDADVDYGHAVGLVVDGDEGKDRGADLVAGGVPAVAVGGDVYGSVRAAIDAVVVDADLVVVAGAYGRAVSRLRGRFIDRGSYAFRVLAGVADGDVDVDDARDLDRCFVIHLDHALNPSTLALRVAASTGAPFASAAIAALSTLEGPLHGGASSDVGALLETVVARGLDDDGVRQWWQALRAQKAKAPGFGHPIYQRRDPRAAPLRALCERAAARRGERRFLDAAVAVERAVVEQSGGKLFANVDFYAACLYATLGVPRALHTALFFAARVSGWAAHVAEQRARGRVLSPEAGYDGPPARGIGPGARAAP
jgi:citrate synthase